MLNKDQTMSLVRQILMFVAGLLITKGWLSSNNATALVTDVVTAIGSIAAAAPIVWGIYAHTQTAMIKSVNDADNGVKVVPNSSPTPPVSTPGVPVATKEPVGRAFAFLAIVVSLGLLSSAHDARAVTLTPTPAATSVASSNLQSWIQNLFAGPQQFTVEDLQAALADANAQTPPDTDHAQCWAALIPVAQTNLPNLLPKGLGVAQLIQKGFDDQNVVNGTSTTLTSIKRACALTIVDVGTNINSFLLKVGVAALPIPKL